MKAQRTPEKIDEYIAACPPDVRLIKAQYACRVHTAAPEAHRARSRALLNGSGVSAM